MSRSRKKTVLTFDETERKLLEKLKKIKEEKKQYIQNVFSKIFQDIISDDLLLEILDNHKEDKNFTNTISEVLKNEIMKKKNF